jgi:hypothetical protein
VFKPELLSSISISAGNHEGPDEAQLKRNDEIPSIRAAKESTTVEAVCLTPITSIIEPINERLDLCVSRHERLCRYLRHVFGSEINQSPASEIALPFAISHR